MTPENPEDSGRSGIPGQVTRPRFDRYIGIDYSGQGACDERLDGLKVAKAEGTGKVWQVNSSRVPGHRLCRAEVAAWISDELAAPGPAIIGIDHAFSVPDAYFKRYGLKDWDAFLTDFREHWPTDRPRVTVESIRRGNPRTGRPDEYRLTDKWTSSAQSVFKLDGQGTVGKSTHTGIPWLLRLRHEERLRGKAHFWPFDGFDPPAGKSVVAEVWPSIFRRRYEPRERMCVHARDASAVARWLQEKDRNGFLCRYFAPPLTTEEQEMASREGWILGVL